MKKFLVSVIAILFFLSPNTIKAQKSQGEWVISAGLGYSIALQFAKQLDSDGTSIPPLYFNADFGHSEHFSLGVGATHANFSSSNNFFGDSYSLSRTNLGVRALFHFGGNPKLDQYFGTRLGVSVLNVEGDVESETGGEFAWRVSYEGETGGEFAWRILYGVRAYFDSNLGVNLEVGIGQPYFFNGGIVYRIQ